MCVRNLAGPLNSAAYATWDDAPGRDFARRGRGDAKGGEGHQRRRRRGEEPAEAARGRRGCRWARPRPQRPPVTARSAGAAPLRGSPWQLSPPPSHGTQATAWDTISGLCLNIPRVGAHARLHAGAVAVSCPRQAAAAQGAAPRRPRPYGSSAAAVALLVWTSGHYFCRGHQTGEGTTSEGFGGGGGGGGKSTP
ncbi:unnamed protein product [Prorocentrum cordatum]|uniref:Uncharacterized protein n=1 Tax=Prorocentrum cordatum TaxID=2364126 RepID=A0ABN9SAE3_9DINO|nr:unnamed protein product [Polarella glacialis]